MRTLLTLLATLAAQHNTSRPQPQSTYIRYSADADGNYREETV